MSVCADYLVVDAVFAKPVSDPPNSLLTGKRTGTSSKNGFLPWILS
jgi:hypothetical protein